MDCEGDGYFHSYDDVESHRLMLRDTERVEAYRRAIEAHKGELQGAAVVDVGAGTGFLACLVAKIACPRVVYAVEASGVAEYARQIADNNGLSGVVRVIRSRMEEAELPEPVDAVISEWMGFHLLHESMLDSVLCARDRFLKQNGIMLPGIARLYASPVSMDRFCQEHFYFWYDGMKGGFYGHHLHSLVPWKFTLPLHSIMPLQGRRVRCGHVGHGGPGC